MPLIEMSQKKFAIYFALKKLYFFTIMRLNVI